jgi:CheY-like chemotaxis protein
LRGYPLKILIVEDSALIQRMYGLALPKREHELHTAGNGREALTLLSRHGPFDVVLLDLNMPDMNGVEFVRELHEGTSFPDTPVIVTTAEPEGSDLVRDVTALGIAALVRKPWKPHELKAVIDGVLA